MKQIKHIKLSVPTYNLVNNLRLTYPIKDGSRNPKITFDQMIKKAFKFYIKHNGDKLTTDLLIDDTYSPTVVYKKPKPIKTHKTIQHLPLELPPEIAARMSSPANATLPSNDKPGMLSIPKPPQPQPPQPQVNIVMVGGKPCRVISKGGV